MRLIPKSHQTCLRHVPAAARPSELIAANALRFRQVHRSRSSSLLGSIFGRSHVRKSDTGMGLRIWPVFIIKQPVQTVEYVSLPRTYQKKKKNPKHTSMSTKWGWEDGGGGGGLIGEHICSRHQNLAGTVLSLEGGCEKCSVRCDITERCSYIMSFNMVDTNSVFFLNIQEFITVHSAPSPVTSWSPGRLSSNFVIQKDETESQAEKGGRVRP